MLELHNSAKKHFSDSFFLAKIKNSIIQKRKKKENWQKFVMK